MSSIIKVNDAKEYASAVMKCDNCGVFTYRLSKFSRKSKFSTWLYSITYNYCIDQIRKEKKENFVQVNDFSRIDKVDEDMYDSEIKETNVFRLKEVMDKMNAEDKCILLMKYQDELSIKDICNILDKTESAVKK